MKPYLGTVTDPVWILKHGLSYFAGFQFKLGQGAKPIICDSVEGAWMFPSPEAAAETRDCEPLLRGFEVAPASIERELE